MKLAQQQTINSSFSSIFRIILPLILSSLSTNLMFLIDRFVLAYYSIDSMNAAMMGGNLAGIFTLLLMSIAGTTEIFVGQYNGGNHDEKIAAPIWQMIYFSIISLIIFIPIGYFSDIINLIPPYYESDGVPYQRILTYFCWLPCLVAAFTGFFVGRGKTSFITHVVIIGNVLNVFLDILLVFGYKNIIPMMGCRGAAIATVISEAAQAIILAIAFWNRYNRTRYSTHKNYHFNKKIFFQCIHIGSPLAIGKSIELFAWYLVYAALSHVSKDLATIHGIAVTIYCFFIFICDGITKGSAALSSNFIGQRDLTAIHDLFRKLIWIVAILCSCLVLPLLIFPDKILSLVGTLNNDLTYLYSQLFIVLRLQFICIVIETLCAIPLGILMSGGDTRYPNIINLALLWMFVVIPVLSLFFCGHLNSVVIPHALCNINMTLFAIIVYRRYRSLKWYNDVENGNAIKL